MPHAGYALSPIRSPQPPFRVSQEKNDTYLTHRLENKSEDALQKDCGHGHGAGWPHALASVPLPSPRPDLEATAPVERLWGQKGPLQTTSDPMGGCGLNTAQTHIFYDMELDGRSLKGIKSYWRQFAAFINFQRLIKTQT